MDLEPLVGGVDAALTFGRRRVEARAGDAEGDAARDARSDARRRRRRRQGGVGFAEADVEAEPVDGEEAVALGPHVEDDALRGARRQLQPPNGVRRHQRLALIVVLACVPKQRSTFPQKKLIRNHLDPFINKNLNIPIFFHRNICS